MCLQFLCLLESPFSLLVHVLPILGSANSVNSNTIGTVSMNQHYSLPLKGGEMLMIPAQDTSTFFLLSSNSLSTCCGDTDRCARLRGRKVGKLNMVLTQIHHVT